MKSLSKSLNTVSFVNKIKPSLYFMFKTIFTSPEVLGRYTFNYLRQGSPFSNKTPAKAFTPPAETKMGTRPGRAVTREFIRGGVIFAYFCSAQLIPF